MTGGPSRLAAFHPEWWVAPAAALSWAALPALVGGPAHGAHGAPPGLARPAAGWVVMTVAMMLPAAAPGVRRVALASRRRRRNLAMAEFAAGHVGAWLPGAALAVWWHAAGPGPSAVLVAGLLAAAAAWELSPAKRRALLACRRSVPLRPRGWAAHRSCLAYGARSGGWCVASCGPAMAAVVGAGHHAALMVPVAAAMVAEKVWVRGERFRPGVALGLGLAAVAVLAFGAA
ncbi:MAG TPA: DUF2182 domain-containing protein [Acidimicrobiales bacterium]